MKHEIFTYGNLDAEVLLLQMIDEHDLEVLPQEVSYIRELTGGRDFCLKAVKVNSWNDELSPWPAPAVFGDEDFGDGAAKTLEYLLRDIIGDSAEEQQQKTYLGGYSLAGLFALWAGTQTDRFSGIAAASPSVWFPSFREYIKEKPMLAPAVYLSLGDREEKTKNPVMAQVGDAIREVHGVLLAAGKGCILEWNKGNHFMESDLRTAKAFAWLLGR